MFHSANTKQRSEPERDRWGRPLILAPGAKKKVAYVRASTIAKTLDSGEGLIGWKQRLTMQGLMARGDLQMAVAGTDPSNKTELNKIAQAAFEHAGGSAAATIGTALHAFVEKINLGQPEGTIPAAYAADIAAYKALANRVGWKVMDTELFVANHDLKVAGSADMVLQIDGVNYIADLKSSQSVDYPAAWAVQFACYAGATPYDFATDATLDWPYDPPSTELAIVIHMPSGGGRADAYWVDITAGAEALEKSLWVRDWRNRGKKVLTPFKHEGEK